MLSQCTSWTLQYCVVCLIGYLLIINDNIYILRDLFMVKPSDGQMGDVAYRMHEDYGVDGWVFLLYKAVTVEEL